MPAAVQTAWEESSQRRRWTFTTSELQRKREHTYAKLSEEVRQHRRLESDLAGVELDDVELPSLNEELCLVNHYARKVADIANAFNMPSHVKSSAMTYLRRFYLDATVLQHHPRSIAVTCLWLATKTCEWHIPLDKFVEKLPKTTRESVLEHEYLVASRIAFDFVHWSPFRALYGLTLELGGAREQRGLAHDRAKAILVNILPSDLLFVHTPSELALAALHKVEPLLVDSLIKRHKLDAESILAIDMTNVKDVDVEEIRAIDKKVFEAQDPLYSRSVLTNIQKRKLDEVEAADIARRNEKQARSDAHTAQLGKLLE
ncbi:hypothetical protein PYCC9005_001751 [Savitreella phatthalungensis]